MSNVFFDTCVYHQAGIDLLTRVIPTENVLFASEMIGAVRGADPDTGFHWDDTKPYVDAAGISAEDRHALFEGNVRACLSPAGHPAQSTRQVVAAIPSTELACVALVVLVTGCALSMTLLSAGVGHAFAAADSKRHLARAVPALASAALAFGAWYLVAALQSRSRWSPPWRPPCSRESST